jgi:hypothetical protein
VLEADPQATGDEAAAVASGWLEAGVEDDGRIH